MIQTEANGSILEITIHRPERKNAFTAAMYAALAEHLERAAKSPEVAVAIIKGGADFSAGNDLQDFLQSPPKNESDPVFRFLRAIAIFPKPLICAVHGYAVGVGTTMLLHADFVYASPQAKFQLPFVNLGLVPEAGSSYLLPRLCGQLRAAELCMLGEVFDAGTAKECGIISQIIPEEQLLSVAREQAAKLVRKPLAALMQTKALLRGSDREALLSQMKKEADLFMQLLSSPEAIASLKSFFERKR